MQNNEIKVGNYYKRSCGMIVELTSFNNGWVTTRIINDPRFSHRDHFGAACFKEMYTPLCIVQMRKELAKK